MQGSIICGECRPRTISRTPSRSRSKARRCRSRLPMARRSRAAGRRLCQRSDLENIFGVPNIIKWAILSANDPDSPAGMAEITARINWAIGVATADFDTPCGRDVIRSPSPAAGQASGPPPWWRRWPASALPALEADAADQDGRPIPDRYDGIFTWAEQQMNFVRSGKLRLDAAVFGKGTNAPEATHERGRGPTGRASAATAPGHSRRRGRLWHDSWKLWWIEKIQGLQR